MTAVLLCVGFVVGGLVGLLFALWQRAALQAENTELCNRLRECNELLRAGRLTGVTADTRRRLTLITSNVRNGVLRGK